ncbi:MAG: TIGR01620 family protein [Pseudomonadota bacterium]
MSDKKGPVLIELDAAPEVTPAEAPAIVDAPIGDAAAMQKVAVLAARRPSTLSRWFWRLALAVITFAASIAAWDFVTGLLTRNAILGGIASVLIGAFILVLLALAIREWAAFARLKRVDRLQNKARDALTNHDLTAARTVTAQMTALYADRAALDWHRQRLAERESEILDADGMLAFTEETLLSPLDAAATQEVEAAARQVATVTALVPIALADLVTALTANLRMIRRVAEIYGGRAGTLGSWRLTRSVLTHLVATGAVAVGDDMIGSVAGGGVLAKISRRFGEGVVNGALTARVGVAAMEVCRPMPFFARERPSVTGLVKRALTGLFMDQPGKDAGDS